MNYIIRYNFMPIWQKWLILLEILPEGSVLFLWVFSLAIMKKCRKRLDAFVLKKVRFFGKLLKKNGTIPQLSLLMCGGVVNVSFCS